MILQAFLVFSPGAGGAAHQNLGRWSNAEQTAAFAKVREFTKGGLVKGGSVKTEPNASQLHKGHA